jgi:hypothetical protein
MVRDDTSHDAGAKIATGPALDLDHLARQTFNDADLEAEVLALFRGQVPVLLARVEAGDEGARRAAAHTLKGSAQGIGAWIVADHARAVEAGDASALPALRAALRDVDAAIAARAA